MTWWRIGLGIVLVGWFAGVLFVGLVLNTFRIDEGPTVIVVDAARGWGLHRMDLVMIAAAVLPILVTALVATLALLAPPGTPAHRPERRHQAGDRRGR